MTAQYLPLHATLHKEEGVAEGVVEGGGVVESGEEVEGGES